MTILDDIIAHKRNELAERKSLYPVRLLEQSIYFPAAPVSLRKYLLRPDLNGIIAEFKRKSPSRGVINAYANVERTTIGYMQAGASALSVLTDKHFFGGSNEDLMLARKFNFCPILRKDFIIDEYQILEAKAIGADAILLIASTLTPAEAVRLCDFARNLQLEVLLEVHTKEELLKMSDVTPDLIGVNNRDLKTFTVDIATSMALAEHIPSHVIKVSESGISSPETVLALREFGYQGFLMGENFMRHSRPETSARQFVNELKQLRQKSVTEKSQQ